jgi:hypothetical protein
MHTFIGWLAVAFVIYLSFFVLKRIGRFVANRRRAVAPLHVDLVDAAEDIASASRVAAVLAGAATFFAAPAGLLAIGAAIGLVSKPLIATLLPILVAFAAGAAALSALAKLYAKSKRRSD